MTHPSPFSTGIHHNHILFYIKTHSREEPGIKTDDKRLIKALKGQAVDRPPFWFMRQAGRYLPEYRQTRAQAGSFLDLCYAPDLATEVTLQPIRRYGMDAAILFADILLIPDALGQPLAYREGEGPVLDPVRDQAGLSAFDPDAIHGRLAPVYETVSNLRAALPAETALIGFAGAPWTVACYMVEGHGSKEFAAPRLWALREEGALRDEAGFQTLIDLLVEATIQYLSRQIEAGAEAVQIFDSWAGVLSPDQFARWSIAPTKAITAALKAAYPHVPVIGFPRGAGTKTDVYRRDTGVDAVSLDTSIALDWAAAALQPYGAVQGNLDPLAVVAGGEAMMRRTRAILEAFSGGPFVFNLGHGFVPETPPENVALLSDFLRDGV